MFFSLLSLNMYCFLQLGDNWKEARKLNVSAQHILVPMHFNVELSKAMVFMDISMPKYVLSVSCVHKFSYVAKKYHVSLIFFCSTIYITYTIPF